MVTLPGVLFIESAAYLLRLLKAEYYSVDQIRASTMGKRISATLGQTFRDRVPALLTAPIPVAAAAAAMVSANRTEAEHQRMAQWCRTFSCWCRSTSTSEIAPRSSAIITARSASTQPRSCTGHLPSRVNRADSTLSTLPVGEYPQQRRAPA